VKDLPDFEWQDMTSAPREGTPIFGMQIQGKKVKIPRKVYWDGKRWRLVSDPTNWLPATAFTKWAPVPDPEPTEDQLIALTYAYRTAIGWSEHSLWKKFPLA
jgi:hypothetical protein